MDINKAIAMAEDNVADVSRAVGRGQASITALTRACDRLDALRRRAAAMPMAMTVAAKWIARHAPVNVDANRS